MKGAKLQDVLKRVHGCGVLSQCAFCGGLVGCSSWRCLCTLGTIISLFCAQDEDFAIPCVAGAVRKTSDLVHLGYPHLVSLLQDEDFTNRFGALQRIVEITKAGDSRYPLVGAKLYHRTVIQLAVQLSYLLSRKSPAYGKLTIQDPSR